MERRELKKFAVRARAELSESISKLNAESISANSSIAPDYSLFISLAALRYMEANRLLPLKFRLSDSEDYIAVCSKLHNIFPDIFPEISCCSESMTDKIFSNNAGFINGLSDIPDKQWKNNPQMIGWLYQYYNSAERGALADNQKQNSKSSRKNIPSATQIFTPEWIVRYMVENSLGKYIIKSSGKQILKSRWKYYIDSINEADSSGDFFSPESIRFLDPCMGSGHILVYAFELLIEVYRSCGYSDSDAARLIIEKNLYGLELDAKACTVAEFELMMTARKYDKDILSKNIKTNLYHFQGLDEELNSIDNRHLAELFENAETLGSLIDVNAKDTASFTSYNRISAIAAILSQRYSAVATNPPYMNSADMDKILLKFVGTNYADYRADLFSVFMVRCMELTENDGYIGLLTPYVWMFIKSYEKLRQKIYDEKTLENLLHFEYSAFEEAVVPVCAFTLKNCSENRNGTFIRLTDFKGGMNIQQQMVLEAISCHAKCPYIYYANPDFFSAIPGKPVAYWLSRQFRSVLQQPSLGDICVPRQGLITGDNERFLRLWFEVKAEDVAFEYNPMRKWFPINKGGEFRRWYGNREHVAYWKNDGEDIKNFSDFKGRLRSRPQNLKYNFTESVSWSLVTSAEFSARIYDENFMFNVAGISIFPDKDLRMYLLALLNSKVTSASVEILNPTMNMNAGDAAKIPVIIDDDQKNEIERLACENVELCRSDWDSFEISWEFRKHPLI